MKAICVTEFGGPEVLLVKELAKPQVGPGQVLVRIKAAGVNPVDTYIRSGTYAFKPQLPYVPGLEGSGIIEELGAGCSAKVGQRVYCARPVSGTYAEYALCQESQVYPIPDHISFEQGAAVYVAYATAYRALFQRGQARKGETLLVHGASGGVGSAAVQLASAAGLNVIGTAGTPEGMLLVKEMGANAVLDHRAPGYLQSVMDLTQGQGVDLILEMLANVNLNNDLAILAHAGRVVVIGNRGKVEIDPRLTMAKDSSILGMSLLVASEEDLSKIHADLVRGLQDKTLVPVVGKRFALQDAAAAHAAVMQGGAYGKIVLTIA